MYRRVIHYIAGIGFSRADILSGYIAVDSRYVHSPLKLYVVNLKACDSFHKLKLPFQQFNRTLRVNFQLIVNCTLYIVN